jgi:hypothetical protein
LRSRDATFATSGNGLEKYSACDIGWTQGRNQPPMVKHPADSVHCHNSILLSCICLAFSRRPVGRSSSYRPRQDGRARSGKDQGCSRRWHVPRWQWLI